MGNCCFRFLSCLFCFFNIVLLIVGATMVALGIWVLATKSVFIPILQSLMSSFNNLVYIFIAVGAFTMFLGLWGLLGLIWGMKYVLLLYIPLLLLIFLLHLFPGYLVYFQKKLIEENLSNNILSLIQTYNPTDEANQTKELAWDYAQFKLSCCGWTGPENWQNNTFFRGKVGTYPCSCSNYTTSFRAALGICTSGTVSQKAAMEDWPVKKQGCGTVVRNWLKKVVDSILFISTIIALSEILGLSLSFYFCMGRKCVC